MLRRILILDIETSPNLAFVWGMWNQNLSPNQVVDFTSIMCWSAKWLTREEVIFKSTWDMSEKEMLEELARLLNMAEVVVAHNGIKFDIPVIRARMVALGISPFSPVKIVDTLRVARNVFRFPSNSLECLGRYLGVDNVKSSHGKYPGFVLWEECLKDNEDAWNEMEKYNKQDVVTLEEVYLRLLPWISNHPNVNPATTEVKCPKCGGDVNRRGFLRTNVGVYQRYQCKKCHGWSKGRYMANSPDERKATLASA